MDFVSVSNATPSPLDAGGDNLGTPGLDTRLQDAQAEIQRLHDLLALVGQELAEPLTAALERVNALVGTGRINRSGLRALLTEVDRARQAGIACQQMARLASGKARLSHERTSLSGMLQNVLAHRSRELQAQGLSVQLSMVPLEVHEDVPMLHALLDGMVDWWLACGQGEVQLQLSLSPWPVQGRLSMRLRHRSADVSDGLSAEQASSPVKGLAWELMSQTAHAMGLTFSREMDPQWVSLTWLFPRAINPHRLDADIREEESGFASSMNSKPLVGSHVLVVASQRDLRLLVRDSLKPMGLVLDFVSSISEAKAFCRQALPHAIVFESTLRSMAFDQLVVSIRKEVPDFVLLELLEAGDTLEFSSISPTGIARVGREAIASGLSSALVYELSNAM